MPAIGSASPSRRRLVSFDAAALSFYFVSYFDFYQPEAYIPRTDTFIEKDSSVNDDIERLRLSTMASLFTRRDVIVVASVSCIYGIGSKEDYESLVVPIRVGMEISREARILAVADVVEAMSSHRPYRAALGLPRALDEIRSGRGRIYDAEAVDACLALMNGGGFTFDEPESCPAAPAPDLSRLAAPLATEE